jgi:hypothetical protein
MGQGGREVLLLSVCSEPRCLLLAAGWWNLKNVTAWGSTLNKTLNTVKPLKHKRRKKIGVSR